MRIFRKYYFDLLKFNLLVSVLGGWFGTSMGRPFAEFFLLSYATVGFFGSLYLYQYFQANEYFFYYNKGIGKLRLYLMAGAVNLAVCLIGFGAMHFMGAK